MRVRGYGVDVAHGNFNILGGEVTVKGDTAAFDASNVVAMPQAGKAVLAEAGASADAIELKARIWGKSRSPTMWGPIHISTAGRWTVLRFQAPSMWEAWNWKAATGVTAYAVTDESGAVSTEGASANSYQIAWDGKH